MAAGDDLPRVLRQALAGGKVSGVTMWPSRGKWQANVRWASTLGWTVEHDEDPAVALAKALQSTTRFENIPAPGEFPAKKPTAVEDDFDGLI